MRFVLYKSGGQYRWRLKADNGRIIADSGEAYVNKLDCAAAIALVRNTNGSTPTDDLS